MTLIPSSPIFSSTNNASTAMRPYSDFSIFFCELMTIITMCSYRKFSHWRMWFSSHIFCWGNGLQVIRIYASAVFTQVVKMQSSRNDSKLQLITKPMCHYLILIFQMSEYVIFIFYRKDAISMAPTSKPFPAIFSFQYLIKKSLNYIHNGWMPWDLMVINE